MAICLRVFNDRGEVRLPAKVAAYSAGRQRDGSGAWHNADMADDKLTTAPRIITRSRRCVLPSQKGNPSTYKSGGNRKFSRLLRDRVLRARSSCFANTTTFKTLLMSIVSCYENHQP